MGFLNFFQAKEKQAPVFDLLRPMIKSSISISYCENKGDLCPVGTSKIGGVPDLPPDFQWFYYQGESYDEITKNRPLSFLAQINCQQVHQFDKDSLLPETGMLYFFYELETMKWGFSPEDKGSAKVYYYAGSVADLVQTQLPCDLAQENRLPELQLAFSAEDNLPDFDEFMQWHDGFEYSQYEAFCAEKAKMLPLYDEEKENKTKLLGYADLEQSSMLFECEAVSNGIDMGSVPKLSKETQQEYKKNALQWQLLFQLDSIQLPEYEMLWGDLGRIYFYIKKEDLKALRFDSCWLILQCG